MKTKCKDFYLDTRTGHCEALGRVPTPEDCYKCTCPTRETCKTCTFKNRCGGFRDRNGRCPEGMVGDPKRWPLKEEPSSLSGVREGRYF